MKQKQKSGTKLLSVLLTLVMLLSLAPSMGVTAWAAEETLLTTITATGEGTASYSPENVATVSFDGSPEYRATDGPECPVR